ncbi:MAG: leucine--tRNA ligase [Gammaproteobacteria bacterium]|nr:MAG: leucine--tRNA ligase [Gammaproteobacteria bacterium]
MEKSYNPTVIERQAQQYWCDNNSFKAIEDPNKEKFYCLCMFPYPSGKLHVGHVRNYTLGDIISRYQRMQGKNVMQPMGWDAFGLPAEGAAIKNNREPAEWTYANIDYMKKQLQSLGYGYDWSRELATCKPDYYQWEQWFFTRLYEKGLVYKKMSEVNWDPVDNTVLANEQVIDGRGWRSGALVEKREIPQWFIRITDYAEELLTSLDDPDMEWPEKVKTMQKNWIGKSVGLEIDFTVNGYDKPLRVFTTRPDTLYGATFMAVAYNHPLAKQQAKNNPELAAFCTQISKASTAEADIEKMEKRGMLTGLTATHPLTGKHIPILVGNFVLMTYGTGAIMAVPAHDQRDFEFAKKYNLPITPVISHPEDFDWQSAWTEKGTTINSGEFNGLDYQTAFEKIADKLIRQGIAEKKINYRLRDWGVSRQRYWGAPIPFYINKDGENEPVPLADLPVVLPENVHFDPTGASPIKSMPEFVNAINSATGEAVQRETDTFDTFMESSWYYARYACPDSADAMLDERANYWLPVDQYIGGIEHAILHLLYARFYHKLLRDEGLVQSDEPFKNLLTQGMVVAPTYYREKADGSHVYYNPDDLDIVRDDKGRITGATLLADGKPVTVGKVEKMSKSKNNGADPQILIDQYGADTVRLYIAFTAPPEQSLEWSDAGVEGAYKYLRKVWHYAERYQNAIVNANSNIKITDKPLRDIRRNIHHALQQATNDFARQQFNTVVSACMKIYNAVADIDGDSDEANTLRREGYRILLLLLSPIAPHIAYALWSELHYQGELLDTAWPTVDDSALVQSEIEIAVQVNGKMRGKILIAANADKDDIITAALANDNVKKFTADKALVKTIVVPKKLVNLVVKG